MATKKNEVVPFSDDLKLALDKSSNALPKDFNKDRFVQNAVALMNENPNLAKYPRQQIIAGLMRGSVLGLDFYNKECYLVPYGSQLNYQTDYRGAVKLCKKYSIRPIKDIYAKLIREGDQFEEKIINGEPTIDFRPKTLNDGKVIGAFAIALYRDGGMTYDVMSLKELETTRSASKAKNSPAWTKFTGEMYKKTVIHRLCKHIELEFENPEQRSEFFNDMAIETDPTEIAHRDIEENSMAEEFVLEDEVIDVDGVEVDGN